MQTLYIYASYYCKKQKSEGDNCAGGESLYVTCVCHTSVCHRHAITKYSLVKSQSPTPQYVHYGLDNLHHERQQAHKLLLALK